MPCPDCGNQTLWYSSFRTVHFIRMISGSPKRYCPACGNMWILKSRNPFNLSWIHVIYLALIGVMVYYAFHGFKAFGQKKKELEKNLQHALLEKAKSEFKARYGNRDLQSLSPEEKKALKEAAAPFLKE